MSLSFCCCRELFLHSFLNETVEALRVGDSIDGRLTMEVAILEAHVEASLVGGFRRHALIFAKSNVIIDSTVEVGNQFCGGGSLIGNKGTDALHLSEEKFVWLRELDAANIAFVFHDVIQSKPSLLQV